MTASLTADRLMTLDEYLRLPDEEGRVELVRGRLVREPPPAPLHGRLEARLAWRLGEFVEEHALGVVVAEAGFILSRESDTVRAPDVAFIAAERVPARGFEGGYWELAPDLAVEIASPSNRVSDVQEKVLDWLDAGAQEVWVVDPRPRTVTIHRPDGRATVLRAPETLEGGQALPGFELSLDDLFSF